MKSNKIQLFLSILFFGGIWGIVEASVGYVLHLLPIFLSGTLMFPFVAFILMKAYSVTKSKSSLVWIGIVAAGIKSVNFFLPQVSVFKTINPMISIVFEALMVMVVVSVLNKDNLKAKLIAFPIASMAWRLLFVANMGIQFYLTGFQAPYIMSFYNGYQFVVLFGLLSGLFVDLVVLADHALKTKTNRTFSFKVTPVFTVISLVLAVVLTIVL